MVPAWLSGLEAARGSLVCLIDSDLQNLPEDVPRLYEAYVDGSADIVQAIRCAAPGVTRNRFFSRGLNGLLNVVFQMHSRDNKSGFILCRREVLTHVLQTRYTYRYFQNFLGVAAHARGYTISEIETIFGQRNGGTSFLSSMPLVFSARVLWEMVKFRVELSRTGEQPIHAAQREALISSVLTDAPAGES